MESFLEHSSILRASGPEELNSIEGISAKTSGLFKGTDA